jgi:2-hydroxychromene-2-carboxylate isomerase
VEPVPILLAALLNHHGHKRPAEIPGKREWVLRDTLRSAALLGVPLSPPPTHPFNPLLALRVASLEMDATTRDRLIDGLFDAAWAGGPGVTDPDVVAGIAREAGVDDAVARASEPATKARLRAQTTEAITLGMWGVPSMLVGDELFWGYDAFPHLQRHLAGEDLLDHEALERWKRIRASATR